MSFAGVAESILDLKTSELNYVNAEGFPADDNVTLALESFKQLVMEV